LVLQQLNQDWHLGCRPLVNGLFYLDRPSPLCPGEHAVFVVVDAMNKNVIQQQPCLEIVFNRFNEFEYPEKAKGAPFGAPP
jgi:hypothetical protein